jgi:hypothetical protein
MSMNLTYDKTPDAPAAAHGAVDRDQFRPAMIVMMRFAQRRTRQPQTRSTQSRQPYSAMPKPQTPNEAVTQTLITCPKMILRSEAIALLPIQRR